MASNGDHQKNVVVPKHLLKSDALYHCLSQRTRTHEGAEITEKHPLSMMATTVDIGVLTGYSLLATALSLPHDGKEKNHGGFDFIFVDAGKNNYLNYHKRLIELVKVGGVIGYDSTLWTGSVVASPDASMGEYVMSYRGFVLQLKRHLLWSLGFKSACFLLLMESLSAVGSFNEDSTNHTIETSPLYHYHPLLLNVTHQANTLLKL